MVISELPGWAFPLACSLGMFVASDLGAWLVCRSSLAARGRWLPLVLPMLGALAAPFEMPRQWIVLRVVLFVIAVTRPPKYWDAFSRFPRLPDEKKGLGRFLLFTLAALYTLLYTDSLVREEPGKGPTRAAKLRVLALGIARLAAGLALLERSRSWRPWEVSFILDHVLKLVELYLIVGGGVDAGLSIMRLAGFRVKDVLDWPVLARSPADFWRRYNTMVHDWTALYLFRSLGGFGRPDLAILAVFVMSGFIHEYVFTGASFGGLGYQMAFFLWQGVGVIATSGLARKRLRKRRQHRGTRKEPVSRARLVLLTAAQILFVLATSVLFLASFEKSIPLHPGSPPLLP